MNDISKIFIMVMIAFSSLNSVAEEKCPDYPGPKNKKFVEVATDYYIPSPYHSGTIKDGAMEYYSSELTALIGSKCTVGAVNQALKKFSACIYTSKPGGVSIAIPPVKSVDTLKSIATELEKTGCFEVVSPLSIPMAI